MSDSTFETNDCGNTSGSATAETPLEPGGVAGEYTPTNKVVINGSEDLSNCIVSESGGYVKTIGLVDLSSQGGGYSWQVQVLANGPEGIGTGAILLQFTDDSGGEPYSLSIRRGTLEWHEVSFNSPNPNLTKIEWSHTD